MFTSSEFPMRAGAEMPVVSGIFSDWSDGHSTPRVSHRVALTVIVGASLGCYALLYTIGSLAGGLFAGT